MPQMRLVMKWASRGSLPRMNTLYPRKMADVLLHSPTRRLAKSILVVMRRLPTIRVIGSHDISTTFLFSALMPDSPLRWLVVSWPLRGFGQVGFRHSGSWFIDACVNLRSARTVRPYVT